MTVGIWENVGNMPPHKYTCAHCGNVVSSVIGCYSRGYARRVAICPHCLEGTYIDDAGKQFPDSAPGTAVANLPNDIERLYTESRNCVAATSYTAAVLTCRKIILHIASDQKAPKLDNFMQAVEHLATSGFVPPHGKGWVDHIRKKGNEANHEIVLMSKSDAEDLVTFVEMLLKFIYEFPNRIPKMTVKSSHSATPPPPAAPPP